jgi:hypothetical protein
MEIYVPISYDGMSAGAIEVYYSMDAVNQEIYELSRNVVGLIVALSVVIVGLTYVLSAFRIIGFAQVRQHSAFDYGEGYGSEAEHEEESISPWLRVKRAVLRART